MESKSLQSSTPEATPPKQADAKPNFVIDKKSDKYKLVFVTNYEGKNITVGEKDADSGRRSRLENFIEQLNEIGERGYRLQAIISGWNPVAVVKLDETQYEYDWFETTSPVFFVKNGFQEKQTKMSKMGFRVIDHFFISQSCKFIDPDNNALGENCLYKDLFLFEKESGVKKPIEQFLVGSSPGWGAKPSVEMETEIDKKLDEGFYPTNVFSKFEILLEKTKDKDDLLNDKPDIQVVRSSRGRGDVVDKVNELARQGYRIGMTNNGIVVMYRNSITAQIPVLYVWLKTDKPSYEKDLAKLQEKGAVYRTTYQTDKGTKNTLIFEQKLKDDGKRAEFRILRLKFDSKENQTEKKVYVDLSRDSQEALKTMNQLAQEGFAVRDLFYSDEVSVILERIQ